MTSKHSMHIAIFVLAGLLSFGTSGCVGTLVTSVGRGAVTGMSSPHTLLQLSKSGVRSSGQMLKGDSPPAPSSQ